MKYLSKIFKMPVMAFLYIDVDQRLLSPYSKSHGQIMLGMFAKLSSNLVDIYLNNEKEQNKIIQR